MSFQKVAPREPIVPGARYRSTYTFEIPYTQTLANLVVAAIKAGSAALSLAGFAVTSIRITPPSANPTGSTDSRYRRWILYVYWHKRA